MEITGLDFIKKSKDDEQEMRVTGLDFAKKKDVDYSGNVTGLDFIKSGNEPNGQNNDHGVTGLDSIRHTAVSSGEHKVSGLDFIKTENDPDQTSEVDGLDSIRQADFSDFGIKKLD